MKQIPLFTTGEGGAERAQNSGVKTGVIRLRDYQQRISAQALSLLEQRKSPLVVAGTGLGKTTIGAEIVKRFPGRSLWLAHRIELIHQARERLELLTGEDIGVEVPDRFSSGQRITVGSKDTVRTKRRLDRLGNYDAYDLIVCDEAHHIPSPSYRTILDAYPNSLRLGLTATPNRLDKSPLKAFDSQTDPYGMLEGMRDGWLVPIKAQRIKAKTVDLSGVSTRAGDFSAEELDLIYKSEANLHAVAKAVLDKLDRGPCLLFSTSVDVAERQAELLCRYRPGIARAVTGKTPELERAELFRSLGRGYRVLCNVGVATEGVDLPNIATVAMARPTKSNALFLQMLGRGLRPLPGIVDGHVSAQDRLAAIAVSAKPHMLVLDFVGNSGRHTVATAAAAFDGDVSVSSEVQRRIAERIESGQEVDLAGALAEELEAAKRSADKKRRKKELADVRLAMVARVELTAQDVRLIGLGGDIAETDQNRIWLDSPPQPGQVSELQRLGCKLDGIRTARDARQRILEARKVQDLASPSQLALISRHNPDLATKNLTRRKAGYIISRLLKRWGR